VLGLLHVGKTGAMPDDLTVSQANASQLATLAEAERRTAEDVLRDALARYVAQRHAGRTHVDQLNAGAGRGSRQDARQSREAAGGDDDPGSGRVRSGVIAFVLDNSVAMRWCFDAGADAHADAVQRLLETGRGAAIVPALWYYEASSVLVRALRMATPTPVRVAEHLEDFAAMNIELDAASGQRVPTHVHPPAVAHRLTSYDAAYLELALRRGLAPATLDAQLVRACRDAGADLLDPVAAAR
jgi:predicted nucleic acid-binding protein